MEPCFLRFFLFLGRPSPLSRKEMFDTNEVVGGISPGEGGI